MPSLDARSNTGHRLVFYLLSCDVMTASHLVSFNLATFMSMIQH